MERWRLSESRGGLKFKPGTLSVAGILAQLRMRREERPDGEIVQVPEQESTHRIVRRANDWLLVHVETGIDQSGDAGAGVVTFKDFVKTAVRLFAHELRSRRAIDVYGGGALAFHLLGAVEGDGHELGRL